MSGKENTREEASQKVVTRYDKKLQRRKEEELREKKRKTITRIVGVAALLLIAAVIISLPIKRYIDTHSAYITVGGHDITRVEYDYYFNQTVNDYVNTYSSLLSYMGFDPSGDLSKQQFNGTLSWKDYFDRSTMDTIKQNKALLNAAAAAGFTYDATEDWNAFEESVKAGASYAGVSVSDYYKRTFGAYATADRIRPYVEEGYLANAYYTEISDSKKATAEEIRNYYSENKESYDSVDYRITEIVAEVPEAATVTAADGTESVAEPTQEEVQAAMDEAKARADEALNVIGEKGEERTNQLKAYTSAKYNEWLFEDARKAGDTTVIEDADSYRYYVLQFEKRYLDETPSVNVRAIASATVSGEDILAEWEANGSTEDAFIALVEKYSEDTYTNRKGGLYEELSPTNLDSVMAEWMYDESRKAGDAEAFSETGNSYVLYYVGTGRPEWQVNIEETLLNETMTDYLQELRDACEVLDPKGHLAYVKKEQAAAETAEE